MEPTASRVAAVPVARGDGVGSVPGGRWRPRRVPRLRQPERHVGLHGCGVDRGRGWRNGARRLRAGVGADRPRRATRTPRRRAGHRFPSSSPTPACRDDSVDRGGIMTGDGRPRWAGVQRLGYRVWGYLPPRLTRAPGEVRLVELPGRHPPGRAARRRADPARAAHVRQWVVDAGRFRQSTRAPPGCGAGGTRGGRPRRGGDGLSRSCSSRSISRMVQVAVSTRPIVDGHADHVVPPARSRSRPRRPVPADVVARDAARRCRIGAPVGQDHRPGDRLRPAAVRSG